MRRIELYADIYIGIVTWPAAILAARFRLTGNYQEGISKLQTEKGIEGDNTLRGTCLDQDSKKGEIHPQKIMTAAVRHFP
jgi:hypothetical protein